MSDSRPAVRNPWAWVPSLYFAQGIPYVVAMSVSVIMYKRMGISNTDIALYTSWLYLPWVIKPLWSPLVDLFRTKRLWIVTMQLLIGAMLASVALTIPLPRFFQYTIAILWLMAFSSATHDIAADGFYMLGLEQHQQAAFVGVRSTFYRIAMISGQGILVILAGWIESSTGGNTRVAWSITFFVLAAIFFAAFVYHYFVLPYPVADVRKAPSESGRFFADFFRVFAAFFTKERILVSVAFLLLYRLAEAQLVKLISPFLLDARTDGGLGLTTAQVGIAYGTCGVAALLCGGLLGGYVISRQGLKFWLWPMIIIINLGGWVYLALAYAQPRSFPLVCAAVAVEQFGYGFGFTAYMLYMIKAADGEHKTAHYALCTGFMALGMMVPGMFSGWMQEWLGYRHFFIWIILWTIPGYLVASLLKIDPEFGRKQKSLEPVCPGCGYNLTGNVSGVCPECGRPVAQGQ